MSRHAAREVVVQLAFAASASKTSSEEQLESFFAEGHYQSLLEENEIYNETLTDKDMGYIRNLLSKINDNSEKIDSYITKYSSGWKIDRVSRTALAILRCSIAEMLYAEDVPTGVSINEAVELSKKYDAPEVTSFINGVLGNFARNELPAEE